MKWNVTRRHVTCKKVYWPVQRWKIPPQKIAFLSESGGKKRNDRTFAKKVLLFSLFKLLSPIVQRIATQLTEKLGLGKCKLLVLIVRISWPSSRLNETQNFFYRIYDFINWRITFILLISRCRRKELYLLDCVVQLYVLESFFIVSIIFL